VSSKDDRKGLVDAAMTVAEDAALGQLDPDNLAAEVQAGMRDLFGTVIGPDDPAWPLQLDVCRQVLAAGGVPANELAEWTAVARSREPQVPVPGESWIEQALAAGADDEEPVV
jgi:hypothetical protein